MLVVYGINNCDTVQRARQRLDEAGITYRFHDFKVQGLSRELVQSWVAALGVDGVLNRNGMTWRKLAQDVRETMLARDPAGLLQQQPALVKRPVFSRDGQLIVGFARKDEAVILQQLR